MRHHRERGGRVGTDPRDRAAAAAPLADRVEWAVFSLLSTAGPLSEAAFLQRIASLFTGHDLPDETLVRACLQSYRSRASTTDRIVSLRILPIYLPAAVPEPSSLSLLAAAAIGLAAVAIRRRRLFSMT